MKALFAGPGTKRRIFTTRVAPIAIACLTLSCSAPPPAPPPAKEVPATWGSPLTPVVSVKHLMRDLIDPLADNIFDAVGTEVTKAGTREWMPRTDADWAKVRIGAVSMAEAASLLKIPRPFTPPGEDNDPEASELLADEIKAKVERDPVLWDAKIEALRNVGREVLEIVEKRDAQALHGANEDLDNACEGCHLEFWYPHQKELMLKLDQALRNLQSQQPEKR